MLLKLISNINKINIYIWLRLPDKWLVLSWPRCAAASLFDSLVTPFGVLYVCTFESPSKSSLYFMWFLSSECESLCCMWFGEVSPKSLCSMLFGAVSPRSLYCMWCGAVSPRSLYCMCHLKCCWDSSFEIPWISVCLTFVNCETFCFLCFNASYPSSLYCMWLECICDCVSSERKEIRFERHVVTYKTTAAWKWVTLECFELTCTLPHTLCMPFSMDSTDLNLNKFFDIWSKIFLDFDHIFLHFDYIFHWREII